MAAVHHFRCFKCT